MHVVPCGSFHPGHQVNVIQARKAHEDPDRGRLGRITDVDPEAGLVTVLLDDGAVERFWHHRPYEIAERVAEFGSAARLQTKWRVLWVEYHPYNLCRLEMERRPCLP